MQDSEGQGRFAELEKGRHHQSTQQRRRARPALSVALELWMSKLSLTVPVLGRCSAGPSLQHPLQQLQPFDSAALSPQEAGQFGALREEAPAHRQLCCSLPRTRYGVSERGGQNLWASGAAWISSCSPVRAVHLPS